MNVIKVVVKIVLTCAAAYTVAYVGTLGTFFLIGFIGKKQEEKREKVAEEYRKRANLFKDGNYEFYSVDYEVMAV